MVAKLIITKGKNQYTLNYPEKNKREAKSQDT